MASKLGLHAVPSGAARRAGRPSPGQCENLGSHGNHGVPLPPEVCCGQNPQSTHMGDFRMWSDGTSGHVEQAKPKPVGRSGSLSAKSGLTPYVS